MLLLDRDFPSLLAASFPRSRVLTQLEDFLRIALLMHGGTRPSKAASEFAFALRLRPHHAATFRHIYFFEQRLTGPQNRPTVNRPLCLSRQREIERRTPPCPVHFVVLCPLFVKQYGRVKVSQDEANRPLLMPLRTFAICFRYSPRRLRTLAFVLAIVVFLSRVAQRRLS